MKAAVLRSGHMVVDTFAEPVPGEGEVLVAVHACGICGSDLLAKAKCWSLCMHVAFVAPICTLCIMVQTSLP